MKRLVIAISLVMAILAIANPIPGQAQEASAPEQQAKNNGAAPNRWASVQCRQGYQLLTTGSSGPIASQTPTVSSTTLFCPKSPTPTVSSNGTVAGTGIVWAIENGNSHNPGPPLDCNGTRLHAALHAFDATTLADLYSSRGVTTTTSYKAPFTTPTVFQGRVYVGALGEVNVFGFCPQSGCLP